MQANKKKPFVKRYVGEDEGFWHKHISACFASGLSKNAYCKENKLNYARFFYWIKKLSVESLSQESQPGMTPLLPIRLMPESDAENTILCTLLLKTGCRLQIHDPQSLTQILTQCG